MDFARVGDLDSAVACTPGRVVVGRDRSRFSFAADLESESMGGELTERLAYGLGTSHGQLFVVRGRAGGVGVTNDPHRGCRISMSLNVVGGLGEDVVGCSGQLRRIELEPHDALMLFRLYEARQLGCGSLVFDGINGL